MRITRIDPLKTYRAQMKEIRKKYAMETIKLKEQESIDKANEMALKLQDQKKRLQDIHKFKRAQADSMFSVFPANKTANKTAVNGGKMHKVFNMTVDELNDYYAKRRADRFSRALESVQKRQEHRTSALLQLFYESSDFITFENMEEKLEIVTSFKGQENSRYLSIDEMVSSKTKNIDLNSDEKTAKRRVALQDALNKTVANGNMGKQEILEIVREYEKNGLMPAESVGVSKKSDLESVMDKMCE